jgi:phosphoribosyl 1,2-cyclic phosphodiesterase
VTLTAVALASGSAGNALLLDADGRTLLLDAGLPLRTLEKMLRYRGVDPAALSAVVLTHEHGDHAQSAAALSARYRLPLICNAPTFAALPDRAVHGPWLDLPTGATLPIGPFTITSFPVAHDAAAPVGLRIRADQVQFGLAVDLGSWTDETVRALHGSDLLVVEANHDYELLRQAPYPHQVRQRIYGPRGHLDNTQCGELIARAAAGRAVDVWLAHLSENSNRPQTAVQGVRRVLELAGVRNIRLTALPRRSSAVPGGMPVWRAADRLLQQTSLFDQELPGG